MKLQMQLLPIIITKMSDFNAHTLNYHIGSEQQKLNGMCAFINDDENSLILLA